MLRWLNRPSRQIAIGAAMAAAAILGTFAYGHWTSYGAALARSERDLRNAAGLLAAHTARTLDTVKDALEAVTRVSQDVQAGLVPRDAATVHHVLRGIHGGSPVSKGIGWIDGSGQQVASSVSAVPLTINISGQEHFRVHAEGTAGPGLYVGTPIRSARDGSWIVNVTQRLNGPGGEFAGIAGATLDPEYLHRVYRGLELGPSRVVTLFRGDGVILAREPGGDAFLGQKPAVGRGPFPPHVVISGPTGTFQARGLADHAERIVGYAPVAGLDFVVTVALTRADALAEFHDDLRTDGIRTGLWVLMLFAGAAMLVRQLRRREQVQAELEIAKGAAEAANAAKADFLSRMSHELRTPLNAIIGFSQLLQMNRERTLTTAQREYSQHILGSGQHLLGLVNEVLDLAGIDSGQVKLSIERVVVAEALATVCRTMAPIAAKAGVALEAGPLADVPDVRADAQRLRQVLLNLVSNAIKYNREAGRVTLSANRQDNGRLRIAVADTGLGIVPERASDLFLPFHRLGAEYTAVEGTGIGLALSKRLVEAMDGTIGFTSELGKGSTFWVELPVETERVETSRASVSDFPMAASEPSRGYSLLYIEDNPSSLQLVEHVVRTLPDVTMLSAARPQLGLDLAVAHRPKVIIVDINLPEMSGFEVLARLKAMPETRDIPVIALSAAAMPKDVKRGLAAGFFAYKTKPFDVMDFIATVEAALASKPAARNGTTA